MLPTGAREEAAARSARDRPMLSVDSAAADRKSTADREPGGAQVQQARLGRRSTGLNDVSGDTFWCSATVRDTAGIGAGVFKFPRGEARIREGL